MTPPYQTDKSHRYLEWLCKCHPPAMGHAFGGDDLRCTKPRCRVRWDRHQRNPTLCVSFNPEPEPQLEPTIDNDQS